LKRFILLVAITAMAFTACTKKGETQSQTATAEQTQTAASSAPSNPHHEILSGDFSAFAGIWENGNGDKRQLRPDGFLTDGSYGDHGIEPYRFDVNGNDANIHYSWMILDGVDINLYPAGVEIMTGDNQVIQSDTTKVRIAVYPKSSNDIYYLTAAGYSGPYVDHYAKILNFDFSNFAGTWVNDHGGGSVVLTEDGLIQDIGFFPISNLRKIGGAYAWDLSTGVVSLHVFLFPAGTEITDEDNRRVQTDITKDRIAIDRRYSNQVYYLQSGAASPQEPAELTGEWHSRSITGSCYGQEHYIFTADGYYRKGDLYQKHDGTWSLVRDAATGKYHLTLQYKQFIDFESGWTPNDITENSEYETIDPNNIKLLLRGTGWIELTRCHNPGWNAQ